MNDKDIYCRKEARQRLKDKGLSIDDAFIVSEYVNSVIKQGLTEEIKEEECDICGTKLKR